jgi:hypothetical protein
MIKGALREKNCPPARQVALQERKTVKRQKCGNDERLAMVAR